MVDVLTNLFLTRGVPRHIRSDNGPEFIAEAIRHGEQAGLEMLYILLAGVTIFDDAEPDDLFSDIDGELNWLVFSLANDTANRVKPSETETDL